MDKWSKSEGETTEKVTEKPSHWWMLYHFWGGICLKAYIDVSGISKIILGEPSGSDPVSASSYSNSSAMLAVGVLIIGYILSNSIVKIINGSAMSNKRKSSIKIFLPFGYIIAALSLSMVTAPIIAASNNDKQEYSLNFVEDKRIGLGKRLQMDGANFVAMCKSTVNTINRNGTLKANNCILYVEGLRTGYGKATTEVLARAALFHVGDGDPKNIDNWDKALSSKFYSNLSNAVSHCVLMTSTSIITKQLYNYIIDTNKQDQPLSSIYFHFLEKEYPGPCK